MGADDKKIPKQENPGLGLPCRDGGRVLINHPVHLPCLLLVLLLACGVSLRCAECVVHDKCTAANRN